MTREEFLSRFDVQDDGCWLWQRPIQRATNGLYAGVVTFNGRRQPAYRHAYEMFVGPIPAGLDIDHLCRVGRCVNPAHLEPVTRRENIMRSPVHVASINARKTHCIRGHEFTPENTIIHCGGKRACRTCVNAGQRRRRLMQSDAA